MNKSIKALVIGLSLASASLSSMAVEAAQKIGYVNTAKVFQALPQREIALQKIQAEFKDRAQELKNIENDIKTKAEKLKRDSSLMSREEVDQLRIELGQLDSSYKIKGQAFKQASAKREAEENQKLAKIIGEAVNKVADKEKFDLIIDAQAVRYAKSEFDISDKVIKAIK
ncbi:OmpH family outer membrane protein [Vibrio sp. RC27]